MSIALQKQIRDNSEDIRGYLDDLGKWTTEMHANDQTRYFGPSDEKAAPPVRGAVNLEEMVTPAGDAPARENLARDKTLINDYYRAWDHFDVDAEEERIDKAQAVEEQKQKAHIASIASQKRTTNAKPNMKVQLRSSVRAKTDEEFATARKDEANKLFAQQRLREARDTYSQALTYMKVNSELRATLLANRALCHLKLSAFADTIKDTEEVLEFDTLHVKARFRKAMAHSKLRQWAQAQKELAIVVEHDAEDKKAQSELTFATRMVNEEAAKRREHAKQLMTYKRPFTMPLRRLHVEKRDDQGVKAAAPSPATASDITSPLRLVTKTETKQPYVIRSLRASEACIADPRHTSEACIDDVQPNMPRPPKVVPNFYDFERRWRNEKTTDKRWALLHNWDLPKLCRESFSSELLLEIVEACHGREDAHTVLKPLQNVRRWEVAYAGLTQSERTTLETLMLDPTEELSKPASGQAAPAATTITIRTEVSADLECLD